MTATTFPRAGSEQLLNQLFGFGAEKHDDLVDALVNLILGLEIWEGPNRLYPARRRFGRSRISIAG